jgi:hypothetical protein
VSVADVGAVMGAAQPTTTQTPETGTSIPLSWAQALAKPFSLFDTASGSGGLGSSWLPNVGLVIVGIVLSVGALMSYQKNTVIQIAKGAIA